MDRTIAPEIKSTPEINFQTPERIELENGVEIFCIRETEDATAKIDFIFDAGSIESTNVIASLTAGMLFTGTDTKTSDEIVESIDILGGFTGTNASSDRATVTIIGLKEHIVELSEIAIDAIINVNFNQKELSQLIQNNKKGLEISLEKVGTIAQRNFLLQVFANSLYGRVTNLEDYDNINREDLIAFFKEYYLSGLRYVTVVGAISDEELDVVKKQALLFNSRTPTTRDFDYSYEPKTINTDKENANQTAIRIGRILFNRKNEEYKKFLVLNTILGGYFGSRLMSSLREDKGYTYGINSGMVQSLESGYFYINTEVNKTYKVAAIEAIKVEVEKMQQEKVSEEELSTVKNYITGLILQQSDGSTAMMDNYMSVHIHGMDLSYYNELIQTVNDITPEEIQELAKKYLNWEDFIIVTAG